MSMVSIERLAMVSIGICKLSVTVHQQVFDRQGKLPRECLPPEPVLPSTFRGLAQLGVLSV
jgi:hypothetical protein